MFERTMIVVAGGTSARFGVDKLTAEVGGRALLDVTIDRLVPLVDQLVVVVREDLLAQFTRAGLTTVVGGGTRTESELAGLASCGESELIGIHDGARPMVTASLVDDLFKTAAERGGAIPGLPVEGFYVDRESGATVRGLHSVQTPQVFWGPELRHAYMAAERAGFQGTDTADIVHQFSGIEIAVVPGDEKNIKVTYPDDLEPLTNGRE